MLAIQMTGICKDCDKGDLYLWDSDQSVFTHNWHVSCKNEDVCKRVEMLCKGKEEASPKNILQNEEVRQILELDEGAEE